VYRWRRAVQPASADRLRRPLSADVDGAEAMNDFRRNLNVIGKGID